MSTIKAANIQNPSAASAAIVLDTSGNFSVPAGTVSAPGIQAPSDSNTGIFFPAADTIAFAEGGTEAMRIDSSSRLLLGTSSGALNNARAVFRGNPLGASETVLELSRGTTVGAGSDGLGSIIFTDSSSNRGAAIIAESEASWTSGSSHSTRLLFSTTASGASSPTERMRIINDGSVFIGKTGYALGTAGIELQSNGQSYFTRSGAQVIIANRLASDGDVIGIYQDTVQEGSISVSGTTVTYGGGHIARWSQLPNDEDPSALLKGTVMSNLDEMCEWGEEDNEQLNKTKVSDVDDDPNVAGVFVSVSPSDDGPVDFFVGMTGDMIIRIAEGVTIQRGDLLVSAGDGTARPQGDRYLKDSTIAKVTSTHVTCTYDDGSYCVPCVLMAC